MDRATRCRHAADTVLHIARRRLFPRGLPPKGDPGHARTEEAFKQARTEVQNALYQSFAGKLEYAVDDLLDEARRHEQNVRITGYDPKEDDPAFRSPAERLREAMRRALEELQELTEHRCEYVEQPNGDRLCTVCGVSGLV